MSDGYAVQEANTEMVNWLSVYFTQRNEPNFSLAKSINTYLMLPGLVGLWPSSIVGASGLLIDVSGNGLNLTNNNNVAFSNEGPGNNLIPYNGYNGTTQYFNRATEAVLNITGTESYIASGLNGLTLGSWIYFDTNASAVETFIAKLDATDRNYLIQRRDTGIIRFTVYNSNVATNFDTTATVTGGAWNFIVCRFDPSTEMKTWINDSIENDTTGIPASIDADAADFTLGATGTPSTYLDGRMCLSFLCASAIPDAFITNLYQQSRGLFGV